MVFWYLTEHSNHFAEREQILLSVAISLIFKVKVDAPLLCYGIFLSPNKKLDFLGASTFFRYLCSAKYKIRNMMNLLSTYFVSSLEKKCNQLVCPECGKHHEVKLRCVNDAIEVSSLEEDACRGFKEKVNAFVKTEVRRHLNDPLPYLR